jgi:hypothetical protein
MNHSFSVTRGNILIKIIRTPERRWTDAHDDHLLPSKHRLSITLVLGKSRNLFPSKILSSLRGVLWYQQIVVDAGLTCEFVFFYHRFGESAATALSLDGA